MIAQYRLKYLTTVANLNPKERIASQLPTRTDVFHLFRPTFLFVETPFNRVIYYFLSPSILSMYAISSQQKSDFTWSALTSDR